MEKTGSQASTLFVQTSSSWVLCINISPRLSVYTPDLFLYSYENEFLDKLIKEAKTKLARRFNLSYCYTDNLISSNNKRFKEFISDSYPKELTISETTESTSVAFYLDLLFTRDQYNNQII